MEFPCIYILNVQEYHTKNWYQQIVLKSLVNKLKNNDNFGHIQIKNYIHKPLHININVILTLAKKEHYLYTNVTDDVSTYTHASLNTLQWLHYAENA